MANEDTRPETQKPEVRDVPSAKETLLGDGHPAAAGTASGKTADADIGTAKAGAPADTAASTPFGTGSADTTSNKATTPSKADSSTSDTVKTDPTNAAPLSPPDLTRPAEPHATTPARPIFLPLLLGGIAAAVIGFGLARAVPGGWPIQDMSPLRTEMQRQAQEITGLRDQIAALTIPNLTPLEGRVSALENPQVKVADLQAQIEELRSQIGEGAISSDLQAVIDRTQQELASAQTQAQALQQQAQDTARQAAVSAALTRIAGALDSGTPYGTALEELQTAGMQIPQPLTDGANGVPAITTLQQEFPEASRRALEESLKVGGDAGMGDRIGAFLRAQTGARSLTPREGDDPDAILSRAEAAVRNGDLAGALREIGSLPLEGQAALSDWRAMAEQRIAAVDALAQLNAGTR